MRHPYGWQRVLFRRGVCAGRDIDRPAALGEIAERVRRSLAESLLELADISMMVRYAAHEWNSRAGCPDDIHTLAGEALQSGEFICNTFRAEEIEACRRYFHTITESDCD